MSQKIKTSVEIDGSLSASQIANATIDTDKFLVSDGGIIKYRTGAELATDLGISAGVTSKVQHQVKAGVAINKGQAVYVTGADGTNMIVGLASNATEATSSKTMGLLNATVSANGFADVITEGLLAGLDTSTAVAGNPVWLGTGGNLIYGLANKPYAPSHLVFIGIVTRVNANNGEIFVKVQNGFELDELHDVDLKTTTPINGHLLGFNGTLWVNKTIAGWLGYTPQAQLNGTGFVKASGTTITYDNTSYYPASNPNGYISTYTETDTLATVTGRGATTSTRVTLNGGWTVPDATMNYVGNFSTNDYSTMRFMSRAWADVQGANGLAYTFNTHTNGGSGGYGALQIYYGESGYVYAPTSFRAPIFYDSNDTGYYVDPASTSNISKLRITSAGNSSGGNILMGPAGEGTSKWSYLTGTHYNATSEAKGVSIIGLYTNSTGNTISIGGAIYEANPATQIDFYTHNAITHSTGGTRRMYIDSGGNVVAASNMQAPIFYDSNDTGYYWNPAADASHRFQTPSGYIDIGPKNGGTCHIYTDRPSFYFNQTLLVNGNTVWHGGNDGSGSGLDADLIDGIESSRIVYGGGSSKVSSHANANEWRNSGFYENDGGGSNWPSGTWYNSINVRHSNQGNYHGFQLAMSYYDNNLWFRSYQGSGTFQGWQRAAVARGEGTNYIDYSRYVYNNGAYSGSGWVEPSDLGVRYALNSTNAGNADTVDGFHGDTFFRNLGFGSGYPSWNANTIDESRSGFTYAYGAPYNGCIAHFGASGYGIQLNGSYGGDAFAMRSRNGDNGTWRPWKTLYTDYNMDAPNKSGTSYYQTNTWMQFNGSYGLYWPSNYGAHLHANDLSSYTQLALRGNKNGYGGFYDQHSAVNGFMYDGSGNGGIYREANGRWYLYHHVGNNCTAISTSTTSSSYRAYVGGSLYAEGDIVAYSDRRKKENIITVDNALDKVNKLRGVYYNRIDDDSKKRQVGVIAQEIQEILPEVVTYAEDVDEYGVSYGNITGLLIEAIKEQQTQIEELKQLVNKLINK